MLEKYRSENQRIVLQKDRDIETLQQHVSKEEKSKVSALGMHLVLLASVVASPLSPYLRAAWSWSWWSVAAMSPSWRRTWPQKKMN